MQIIFIHGSIYCGGGKVRGAPAPNPRMMDKALSVCGAAVWNDLSLE